MNSRYCYLIVFMWAASIVAAVSGGRYFPVKSPGEKLSAATKNIVITRGHVDKSLIPVKVWFIKLPTGSTDIAVLEEPATTPGGELSVEGVCQESTTVNDHYIRVLTNCKLTEGVK
jgi:hypothetical protein